MTPSIRLQVENDARIAIARCGPLAADPVDALARQSRLLAPAKLVRGDDGACELRAEVLRSGRVDAGKLARNALDAARAWLAGETPAVADPAADAERISERVACGLDELPRAWAWEPAERGGFHEIGRAHV